MKARPQELEAAWVRHQGAWRDPAQITSQWQDAASVDPAVLKYRVRGSWWETLAAEGITLLVTREYEHLLMGVSVTDGKPKLSYLPLPHPSGLAVDREREVVYLASTRNPNQVYDLMPATGALSRLDVSKPSPTDRPLVPVRSRFLPGSLYLHDLALIGGDLFANAVGENAVVRLPAAGGYQRAWWPRCVETAVGPMHGCNHLQLNSIAAGPTLETSYFSASTDRISARRPGHRNFPVDRRGVLFSGAAREPVVRGLTRPHSARLHGEDLWVANSGYGELGYARDGAFSVVARLPGWTRGLCFHRGIAFVGTSRVLPRFRQYAPGLDLEASRCAVHAVEVRSGRVLGSIDWPAGNQLFAVEWVPREMTAGLPFTAGRRPAAREKRLFYTFRTAPITEEAMTEKKRD